MLTLINIKKSTIPAIFSDDLINFIETRHTMQTTNIHLNRPLYEFYPFSYFIFGTAFYLLISGHEVLRVTSLLACFGAGFLALLIRSKHRHEYRIEITKQSRKLWMPKPLYEVIPVFYVIVGVILMIETIHVPVFIAGLFLSTVGCYFVASRIMFRLVFRR